MSGERGTRTHNGINRYALAGRCNASSASSPKYSRSHLNREITVSKTAGYAVRLREHVAENVGLDPTLPFRGNQFSRLGRCNYALVLQVDREGFEPSAPAQARPDLQSGPFSHFRYRSDSPSGSRTQKTRVLSAVHMPILLRGREKSRRGSLTQSITELGA